MSTMPAGQASFFSSEVAVAASAVVAASVAVAASVVVVVVVAASVVVAPPSIAAGGIVPGVEATPLLAPAHPNATEPNKKAKIERFTAPPLAHRCWLLRKFVVTA